MKQGYTLNIYTENQVGLLNRIAIMFSRRKINIESLNTLKDKCISFLQQVDIKKKDRVDVFKPTEKQNNTPSYPMLYAQKIENGYQLVNTKPTITAMMMKIDPLHLLRLLVFTKI